MRLINLNDNSLLHKCFIECHTLNENNITCWLSHIESILKFFNFDDIWNNPNITNTRSFTAMWKNINEETYKHEWMKYISNESVSPKLRSFAKLKSNFQLERYLLNMKNHKAKRLLTKLRISSHNLHIETGRYHKPKKTPLQQRICYFCNSHSVEDELHLILDCTFYDEFRSTLFTKLEAICDFNQLSDIEKFKLIMSANNGDIDFCLPIGTFLISCFEKRDNTILPINDN